MQDSSHVSADSSHHHRPVVIAGYVIVGLVLTLLVGMILLVIGAIYNRSGDRYGHLLIGLESVYSCIKFVLTTKE